MRVLIAEDFGLFREGVAIALDAHPEIEVVGLAADGREAFERACELQPDVIVLDLRMPEHGGMEVLDLCRATLPETKILVLTANENPDNLRDAMAAGAAGFLTKRTSASQLCEAVITVDRGGTVVAPELAARLSGERDAEPEEEEELPLSAPLSARERSVVRLVSQGLTDDEIAGRLFVSVRTVQYDLARIRAKTGLTSRSGIGRWAVIHALR